MHRLTYLLTYLLTYPGTQPLHAVAVSPTSHNSLSQTNIQLTGKSIKQKDPQRL